MTYTWIWNLINYMIQLFFYDKGTYMLLYLCPFKRPFNCIFESCLISRTHRHEVTCMKSHNIARSYILICSYTCRKDLLFDLKRPLLYLLSCELTIFTYDYHTMAVFVKIQLYVVFSFSFPFEPWLYTYWSVWLCKNKFSSIYF